MHKLPLLLLIIVGHAGLCQQQNELSKMELRGRVKELNLVSFQPKLPAIKGKWEQAKLIDSARYQFNEQGNLSGKNDYFLYGYYFGNVFTYLYDEKGRVATEIRVKYDEDDISDILEFRSVYEYDDSDLHVRKTLLDRSGKQPYDLYTYDYKGKIVSEAFYDRDGQLEREYIHTYDDRGNRIFSGNKNARQGTESNSEWISKYDKAGHMTEQQFFKTPGKLTARTVYQYNSNGDVIQSHQFDTAGKSVKKLSFKYEYDSQLNWVRKIEYENDQPTVISKRLISYF